MSNCNDWNFRYAETNTEDFFAEACKEFGERAYRNMFREVTCFECEHYRQDTDDGVICPRCVKDRSVLVTNGKKTRCCFDFDEIKEK